MERNDPVLISLILETYPCLKLFPIVITSFVTMLFSTDTARNQYDSTEKEFCKQRYSGIEDEMDICHSRLCVKRIKTNKTTLVSI